MGSPRRLAVIDLGTNTFHLLVVERNGSENGWREICRERRFVNLADDGIGHISRSAFGRAVDAIGRFRELIDPLDVSEVRAVGTAALRTADNSAELREVIAQQFGIHVEVITGAREAQLIALGVEQALPAHPGTALIIDIGGGSVECIIDADGKQLFSRSYPIGVAVLYDRFHHSEPLSVRETEELYAFLEEVLSDLCREIDRFPEIRLVGASGSFEVIYWALNAAEMTAPYAEFDAAAFAGLRDKVCAMTLDERLGQPYIPESRARYIVVAFLLIDFFVRRLPNPTAGISQYALKEGIATEWLRHLD